jgi:hypothetical protein
MREPLTLRIARQRAAQRVADKESREHWRKVAAQQADLDWRMREAEDRRKGLRIYGTLVSR